MNLLKEGHLTLYNSWWVACLRFTTVPYTIRPRNNEGTIFIEKQNKIQNLVRKKNIFQYLPQGFQVSRFSGFQGTVVMFCSWMHLPWHGTDGFRRIVVFRGTTISFFNFYFLNLFIYLDSNSLYLLESLSFFFFLQEAKSRMAWYRFVLSLKGCAEHF